MPTVILKDRNGDPVSYGGIDEISIPGTNGDEHYVSRKSQYICVIIPSSSTFEVYKNLAVFKFSQSLYSVLYESWFKDGGTTTEAGAQQLHIIVTSKYFEEGKSYPMSEITGGE